MRGGIAAGERRCFSGRAGGSGLSRSLGAAAEDRAVAYLVGLGYEILDRNFTCKMGELDIVARKDGVVIFVEVKSRAHTRFGLAQEAVVYGKRAKLLKAAAL